MSTSTATATVTIEITQEEELDWLRYSNESLRKQRQTLQERVNELENAYGIPQEIVTLTALIEDKNALLKATIEQRDYNHRLIVALIEKLDQKDKDINALQVTIDGLLKENEFIKRELKASKSLQDTESSLASKLEDEVQELKDEIQRLNDFATSSSSVAAESKELVERLSDRDEELHALRDEKIRLIKREETMRYRAVAAEEDYNDLQLKYEDLKEAFDSINSGL